MHVHTRTHTHAHTHARMHARTHTRTHARMHARTQHTHTHSNTHIHLRVHILYLSHKHKQCIFPYKACRAQVAVNQPNQHTRRTAVLVKKTMSTFMMSFLDAVWAVRLMMLVPGVIIHTAHTRTHMHAYTHTSIHTRMYKRCAHACRATCMQWRTHMHTYIQVL